MKLDPRHKTEKLAHHIPGFLGYGTIHHLETDLLLRRHMAGEVEKVKDRLADFIASHRYRGRLQERLSLVLRTVSFLKSEILLAGRDENGDSPLSSEAEERLLDFDLAILEKVAGLHTPLDRMEAALSPEELETALDILDEGVAEVDDLFRERRRVLQSASAGTTPSG